MRKFDPEQFRADKLEALRSLDREKILAYSRKYKAGLHKASTEDVFWAAVHKARVGTSGMTPAEIYTSIKWLRHHGFDPYSNV